MAATFLRLSSFANVSRTCARRVSYLASRQRTINVPQKISLMKGKTVGLSQEVSLLQIASINTLSKTVNSYPFLDVTIKQGLSRKYPHYNVRCINMRSKLGKRKTCKAVAKRFLRTGKGKLKRWQPGRVHNMRKKSSNVRRRLKKPVYATKKQLKLLNKMLNGW